nr:uncharacterized protein LOC120975879 [Aegilops tauschii subsp. strangulata]
MLMIPSVLMRKCLLKFIIKSYALDRKRFIMPSKNGAISLRTEDVFDIFGLQNKGKDAMKALGKGGLKAKVKVPSRFLDSNTGEMMIDELIENIIASGTYDDDFLRRIVLVLLGTVLAPQSTKEVPNAYYKLHKDLIRSYKIYLADRKPCPPTEDEAKKRDAYDTSYGRGNGTIDDVISEKYRQTLIAQQGRKAEEELEQEDRAQKRKIIEMRLHRAGIIVVEKLEKKGLVFKPNKGSDDDIEFVEHSEDWVGKYGPSKYKSSKYWTGVKSTPAKEDMDNRVDASFTTGNWNKLAREKGVHHNTPGTGDEGDPFVIEDNGNSPNPSLATVDTNDFPAITSTPKIMNEVSDGSSADKSEEISMDSLNTRIKNAKENGTPKNDGKENDGKRKRKQSKYCLSPYQQNGGRLFGIRAAMINTDYINEDHIEAAKVYIRTLADSENLCSKTVVHMTGIGGETCTPEMLEAIISKKWLHGGVINSYCNHMQTHNPRADRHILSSWVSHWLILRADGKVNNSKRHFMDHFTNQTKMVSRVTEEYFIKDKAYFPFHVEENHWITVLMHNKKKEFQVLNSTGKCSKRVLAKIAKLRAEIANDTKQVNALIETEHPDVSSWPIREYDMPSQTDGVSCGLFVVKCVQNWDGDDWTFEFDQDEVNASRGRILAEILFSECNTKEVVKEKILKIMEKK